jgi:hypothetical protein
MIKRAISGKHENLEMALFFAYRPFSDEPER